LPCLRLEDEEQQGADQQDELGGADEDDRQPHGQGGETNQKETKG